MRIKNILRVGALIIYVAQVAHNYFTPYPYNPYSLVLVIPGFLVSSIIGQNFGMYVGFAVGALIAPSLFYVMSCNIVRLNTPYPKSSVIIYIVTSVASILFAVGGWGLTVQYGSITRAVALVAQAISPLLIILCLWVYYRRSQSITQSLYLHLLGLLCLGTSAFPWYGELI